MENYAPDFIKSAIEALLFISEKPVALEQIKEALQTVSIPEIRKVVEGLQQEYESTQRGMVIIEIAGGYQMLSSPRCVTYVRNFFKTRVKEKLSRPSLESLAIIAYKQPVSRADIELIRGVNSDGVVNHLLSKGLIKIVGRKDIPGRPFLYGTTKLFLEYFGLKALQDLPKLEDIPVLPTDGETHKILPVEEGEAEAAAAAEGAQGFVAEGNAESANAASAQTAESAEIPATIEQRMSAVSVGSHPTADPGGESPLELKMVMDELIKEEDVVEHDPEKMYPRASENPAGETKGLPPDAEENPGS